MVRVERAGEEGRRSRDGGSGSGERLEGGVGEVEKGGEIGEGGGKGG